MARIVIWRGLATACVCVSVAHSMALNGPDSGPLGVRRANNPPLDLPPACATVLNVRTDPPDALPDWLNHYVAVFVPIAACCLTCIFAAPVLAVYVRVPCMRQQPNNLVLARTCCDVGICATLIGSFIAQFSGYHQSSLDCTFCSDKTAGQAFAVLFQAFLFSSEAFYCFLSLHLFAGNHPFSKPKMLNRTYYAITLTLAVGLGVALLSTGTGSYLILHHSTTKAIAICWLRNNPNKLTQYSSWTFLFGWICLSYVVGTFYSLKAQRMWKTHSGKGNTHWHRQNALERNQAAVAVYTIYSVIQLVTVVPALFNTKSQAAVTAAIFTLAMRGVADCVVWYVCMYHIKHHNFKIGATAMLLDAFGSELLFGEAYKNHKMNRDTLYAADADTLLDPSLNDILQEELVIELSYGITEDASSARSSRRTLSTSSVESANAMELSSGWDTSPLLDEILHESVGDDFDVSMDGGVVTAIRAKQFDQIREAFGVTDQILREAFPWGHAEYMAEPRFRDTIVSGNSPGLDTSKAWVIREAKARFTEAGSGAFLFFSKKKGTEEGGYLVKSLSNADFKFFNGDDFFQKYFDYMMTHKQSTYLPRFYGLYQLKKKQYGHTMYFCLMENVFPASVRLAKTDEVVEVRVDDRYDLKGSSANRSAKPPKEVAEPLGTDEDKKHAIPRGRCKYCHRKMYHSKNRCRSGVQTYCQLPRLYKDNDINFSVCVSEMQLEQLVSQIGMDTEFLASCNVMDYSLLLGVQYAQMHVNVEGAAHLEWVSDGEEALTPSIVSPLTVQVPRFYFFGLIDILQCWTLRKKLERWLGSWVHSDNQSSVDPATYQARFMKNVIREKFKPPFRDRHDLLSHSELQSWQTIKRGSSGGIRSSELDTPRESMGTEGTRSFERRTNSVVQFNLGSPRTTRRTTSPPPSRIVLGTMAPVVELDHEATKPEHEDNV